MKKRSWLWVFLFISVIVLLGTLATGWNLVLVRDHLNLLELAEKLPKPPVPRRGPWLSLILGSVGFLMVILGLVLFFVKVLREMKLNQAQSEFIASMSHELKTPIATIELCSSLLRLGATPAESQTLWTSYDSELRRLKEQVDTLLEAARWQAHDDRLQPEKIQLENWLNSALGRWKTILGPDAQIRRRGDRLDGTTVIDPRALDLISDNLVDNAKKFSRGTTRLTVESQLDRKKWRLRFTDEGWGFHPQDSEKIFKRFKRGKSVAPYSVPGTGLGLFLAASASKASGLKLTGVSNGLELGATFTIEGRLK